MSTPRSGRRIVYPNQIALETDVLYTNLYKMVDVSMLAQALIGNGFSLADCVAGLACTPVGPTSFSVNIGPGTYYSYQELDATAYSSIPSDTVDMLYKQYVNLSTFVQGDFAAPGSGNNFYLLQAIWQTADVDPVNSAYYDSNNPNTPIFNTADTTRFDNIVFSTKVSTSSTPTPDANHVGLYAITIPSGASGINSGMISVYPGAPFINPSVINAVTNNQLQQSSAIFAVDSSGSPNTITVNPSPAYSALVAGSRIYIKVANTNTGATSINISGLGGVAARKISSSGISAFVGYETIANYIYEFMYDGSHLLLLGQVTPNMFATLVMGAGQSISNNTSTLINFSTLPSGYDPFGMTNTGNKSITVPIPGLWEIEVNLTTNTNSNTIGGFAVDVFKQTGVSNAQFFRLGQQPYSTATDLITVGNKRNVILAAGDIITVEATSDGGNGCTVGFGEPSLSETWFSLKYLGN